MTSMNVERSQSLFNRARQIMPGGVNSPVRAFAGVGGTPRFMSKGQGAYLWDADGNQYIDMVMSWGPLIHGHAFPPILAAITEAAAQGTSFGASTEREVILAESIKRMIPSMEMMRFVSSGTEATMSAIRLARAFTQRDLIVKFAGNYHGHADMLLAQAGSGVLTLGLPASPGVPEASARSTLVLPYNDVPSLEHTFTNFGTEIAAVIVEPIAGNMGVVPPESGFLAAIRRLTERSGALFIADEVITGFRVGVGGAQQELDFIPDLTTLGKIIGGGLPVGVFGGRRDILEHVAPSGPVYQAGTLSGNPLAMAAGLAALQPLEDPDFYLRLSATTQHLAESLREMGQRAGLPIRVNAVTGMLTVFFTEQTVANLESAQTSDTERYACFFHAMLDQGVYLPPSQFEAWMVSPVHTPMILDRLLSAAWASMQIR